MKETKQQQTIRVQLFRVSGVTHTYCPFLDLTTTPTSIFFRVDYNKIDIFYNFKRQRAFKYADADIIT
jgi:hypothetical protein